MPGLCQYRLAKGPDIRKPAAILGKEILAAGDITVKVCYAAKEDAKIRFDFGEGTKRRQGPVVELHATGGEWVTVDAFTMKSDVNGWRRTVLNIVAGKPDLNYFTITVEK